MTFYVAPGGNDANLGINWAQPKFTIQSAIDAAGVGDVVMVTNGVYDSGTRVTPGFHVSNRVVITRNITVQSVNGPSVTFISGLNGTSGSLADSVRCVYITNGVLSGFSLTNGSTVASGGAENDLSGGRASAMTTT